MSTITTPTHVFFYTDYMSNWWSTREMKPQFTDPITLVTFNNTEEAFMWQKANFFDDFETAGQIVAHAKGRGHPRDVKALGRLVKGYDDKAWECVREGFMAYVNLLKYRQNPDLAAQLKETGYRILVEASPVDKVWGVGLDVQAAAEHARSSIEAYGIKPEDIDWPGRNLLGKALMTVRGLL